MPFRNDIEGLRGIAVALVVLFHFKALGFAGGFIGVDVFFVISGYLITGILIHELTQTGRIDLSRFYARRIRRLLPASLFLMAMVALFARAFYLPDEQKQIAETLGWVSVYASNFQFAISADDYFAADTKSNPLLHTWSLAVEEQFYFVWPALIVVASKTLTSRKLLLVISICAVCSFGLTIALQETSRNHWAFFAMPARAWELAVGAIASLLKLRPDTLAMPLRSAISAIALLAIVLSGLMLNGTATFPGLAALPATLGTAFLLWVAAPTHAGVSSPTRAQRMLESRVLQWLGRHSYSLYLWHWPVLVFAAGVQLESIERLPVSTRLLLLVLSFALAAFSYSFVESPATRQESEAKARSPRIWSPPVLQGLVVGVTGTGLLPYIRPVYEEHRSSGLDEIRAYCP